MRATICVMGLIVGSAACGEVSNPVPMQDGSINTSVDTGVGIDVPALTCMPQASHDQVLYRIDLFETADGHSGTDPACMKVGMSFTSTNPQLVWCRRMGTQVSGSQGFNHWWLWTELDQPAGAHGWISAYHIQGQGNNEANDKDTGQPIANCP